MGMRHAHVAARETVEPYLQVELGLQATWRDGAACRVAGRVQRVWDARAIPQRAALVLHFQQQVIPCRGGTIHCIFAIQIFSLEHMQHHKSFPVQLPV